ncbi:5,10-methylene-tetrahydrofolate dehydrogenase/methenyl tetrahydrofolate cyclohydrolase [Rhodococcus sp. 27YEA15]|uniref:tetrahydrofolate dehydrogenase/cyclohydrolase catalytic domain-containing protein n=1 Tax=Rhodococcus sp. 27YEA15 TaxID=3156259 RepID=UPI003C7B2E03
MPARIIDGRKTAAAVIAADTAAEVEQCTARTAHVPCLAAVVVGSDPASRAYVAMRARRCATVGIASRVIEWPATTTMAVLEDLSADPLVDGILLQHRVPSHIDERAAFDSTAPAKDVDGVTSASFASMTLTGRLFESWTPSAILRLLDSVGVRLAGANAVVVGRSPILRLSAEAMLLRRDVTVTYCHSHTEDLEAHRGSRHRHSGGGSAGTGRRRWGQAGSGGRRRGVRPGRSRRRRVSVSVRTPLR